MTKYLTCYGLSHNASFSVLAEIKYSFCHDLVETPKVRFEDVTFDSYRILVFDTGHNQSLERGHETCHHLQEGIPLHCP